MLHLGAAAEAPFYLVVFGRTRRAKESVACILNAGKPHVEISFGRTSFVGTRPLPAAGVMKTLDIFFLRPVLKSPSYVSVEQHPNWRIFHVDSRFDTAVSLASQCHIPITNICIEQDPIDGSASDTKGKVLLCCIFETAGE